MYTLASILSFVTSRAYMATIDLRHAYYTIPVANLEHQKFLKFFWNSILYQSTVLPMGLFYMSTNFHEAHGTSFSGASSTGTY